MNLNFDQWELRASGENFPEVPVWFYSLTEFSYEVCSKRNIFSPVAEHFVLSLPSVDGCLAALALGSMLAEVERIENDSNLVEIDLTQLEPGMKVAIESGQEGQQRVTGQIKSISLEDRIPRIQIGTKSIATKFIKKLFILPSEFGNPELFGPKPNTTFDKSNLLEHLAFSSIPLHRVLIDVRAPTKLIEDELQWEFSNPVKTSSIRIVDLVQPIASGQPGSGRSLVLNTTESEDIALKNLKTELNSSELDSDVSILCSGAAILAQLETANSKIVFSALGRDDRQLVAAELAIKQKYEYSQPLSRDVNFKGLGSATELITFEVPLNV
jgi:hypothetical protein